MSGSIRSQIVQILTEKLKPLHLEVLDESHMHSRRTPDNPETHFKVTVVSAAFDGLNRVQRQQMVYAGLKELFDKGLHAVSQATFSPEEWKKNPQVHSSPACGGHKP